MTAEPHPRVLIVAREPGAAAALVPVARRTGATILAFDSARLVFERAGLAVNALEDDAGADVAGDWLKSNAVDVLLTGTSRQELAARDDNWWRAARIAGIPSVALLDHWIGYRERFTVLQPFDALPDVIAVMDDFAGASLVELGAPADRVVVTGHPALDDVISASRATNSSSRVILFASEPLAADVGNARGYDEVEVLDILLRALGDAPLRLIIKPHPREQPDRLAAVARRNNRDAIIETTLTGREAVAQADIVVGMTSILLLEAALGGRPVLSIQPGLREPWTHHFQTLITTVESVEGARDWLQHADTQAPLEHDALRARIRAAGFDERGNATDNVCRLLLSS